MANMAGMFRMMGQDIPEPALILEINPDHTIVKRLNNCNDDKLVETISWLLLDQAKMAEGLQVKDPILFTKRLNEVMSKAI
jgi:molecular chaperone HtpG